MISKCQHCHGRVLPLADRTCPACGKNMDDFRNGVDAGTFSIEVGKTDCLPPLCYLCAESTNRVIKVRTKSRIEEFLETVLELIRLIHFSRFRPDPMLGKTRRLVTVHVKVPCCEACEEKQGAPRILFVDHDLLKVTIQVHEKFKEAALRLRKSFDK